MVINGRIASHRPNQEAPRYTPDTQLKKEDFEFLIDLSKEIGKILNQESFEILLNQESFEFLKKHWKSLPEEEKQKIERFQELEELFKQDQITPEKITDEIRGALKKLMIDKLSKEIKGRDNLEAILEQLHLKDRIVNLFGLVYIPEDYEIIAVTDIHGDINALESAIKEFEERKKKNEKVAFVCLGDFVDRGEYSFEVVKRLFELKKQYKDEVVILQADHEGDLVEFDEQGTYKGYKDKPQFAWTLGGIDLQTGSLIQESEEQKKKRFELRDTLYRDTFRQLPYSIIWGNRLFLHASLPIEIVKKANEESLQFSLGNLIDIGENREALESVFWHDIEKFKEGMENIRYIRDEDRPEYDQRGVGKLWNSKTVAEFLKESGIKALIRGHDPYVIGNKEIAYVDFVEKIDNEDIHIITFHSNQSYYADEHRDYGEGCFLILTPDGGVIAQGVVNEGKQEVIIEGKKEEQKEEQPQSVGVGASTGAPGSPEGPSGSAGVSPEGEQAREGSNREAIEKLSDALRAARDNLRNQGIEIPENLNLENFDFVGAIEKRLEKELSDLKENYKDYIGLLSESYKQTFDKYVRISLLQNALGTYNLLPRALEEAGALLKDYPFLAGISDFENFAEKLWAIALDRLFDNLRKDIEHIFKFTLGLFLLSDPEVANKRNQVKPKIEEFLKGLRLSDRFKYADLLFEEGTEIIDIETESGKVLKIFIRQLKPLKDWVDIILLAQLEGINNKQELLTAIQNLENKIKTLKKKLEEEKKEAERKGDEGKIRSLEEQLRNINNFERAISKIKEIIDELTEDEIKAMKERLKEMEKIIDGLIPDMKEAEKTGKKPEETEKGKEFLSKFGELGSNILQFLAAAGLLWFAFIGILLPLWFIEKAKKEIEPAFKK